MGAKDLHGLKKFQILFVFLLSSVPFFSKTALKIFIFLKRAFVKKKQKKIIDRTFVYPLFGILLLFLTRIQGQESFTSLESRQAVEQLLNRSQKESETFSFDLLQQWLMTAHPNDVRLTDLHQRALWLEQLLQQRHQVEGLLFPLLYFQENGREYYQLNRGGDVALYTGTYLAGQVFRYLEEPQFENLKAIARTVEGLHKVTHISGKKGFPCRFALPLSRALPDGLLPQKKDKNLPWYHIYYAHPQEVLPQQNYMKNLVAYENIPPIAKSRIGQKLTPEESFYTTQFYYTRTTRDQLTGIIFGLAVTLYAFEAHYLNSEKILLGGTEKEWAEAILSSACEISLSLYEYLQEKKWKMKDPLAKKSGTSADRVTGLLKISVQMLARRALMNSFPKEALLSEEEQFRLPEEKKQAIQLWQRRYQLMQRENSDLLPEGIQKLEGLKTLSASSTWFGFTTNYYAWNLRTERLFSIILLDAVHPDFLRHKPDSWPESTLSQESVNKRNRMWMEFWNDYLWKYIARDSNIWFTYLYNYARRLVYERHLGPISSAKDLYELQPQKFEYLFWWKDQWESLEQLRDQALFNTSYLYEGPNQTLGVGLDRAHFHLRSLALIPIRSYSRPAEYLQGEALSACFTTLYGKKIIAPHLRPFSRFWLEGKEPDQAERPKYLDQQGNVESILIDLPVLYWLGKRSGVLEYRYQNGFYSYEFTPPKNIVDKK